MNGHRVLHVYGRRPGKLADAIAEWGLPRNSAMMDYHDP